MEFLKKLFMAALSLLPFYSFSQRVPAEWEKQDGIIITWFLEDQLKGYSVDVVHLSMIESLVADNTIYINYQNSRQKKNIENLLILKSIDTSKIKWIKYDISMGAYPRDYGPEWIYNNKELQVIDMNWTFYGYIPPQRKYAKLINKNLEAYDRHFAKANGLKIFAKSNFVSEGGGKEFNGAGVLMVVEQTELQRNPACTKQQIEEEYKKIFNLKKIIWLPKPSYDDENMFTGYIYDKSTKQKALRSASANGHIDEFCRFVNANTILLAEVTQQEADADDMHKINKERLDSCYEILKKQTDINGKPFTIARMPVADLLFKEVDKSSGVYKNIYGMKEAVQLDKLLDGSSFPKGDTFLVLPALSYCNFSIANNTVLVSKYWKQGMPQTIKEKDERAAAILKNIFPGRKVVAIDAMAINLGGGGGLHCNTKHVPAKNEK
jgi:agmatine deiminase